MRLKKVLVVAVSSECRLPAFAQDAFPARAITMIVAFPPGGVADITARPDRGGDGEDTEAAGVGRRTGPAPAGAVGNAAVANAKPDGYTILMALSSISVIPAADELFNRKPAYSLDQFAPIALIYRRPDDTGRASRRCRSRRLKELVALARSKPGQLSYLVVRHLRRAAHADGDVPARDEA